jgi:hypothetical protein
MWPGLTAAEIAVILRVLAWHNELVKHPNDIEPGDAERRRRHSHGGPWERVNKCGVRCAGRGFDMQISWLSSIIRVRVMIELTVRTADPTDDELVVKPRESG